MRKLFKIIGVKISIRAMWYEFLLHSMLKNWIFLNFISKNIRPSIVRHCGAKVGKGVFMGLGLYVDRNANYLTIEDNVYFAPNVQILCHKRCISSYFKGDQYSKLKLDQYPTKICKGAMIGLGAIIMPDITIGEGAIVAGGSVVVKDVPAWTIVGGNPAKVLRVIGDRTLNIF